MPEPDNAQKDIPEHVPLAAFCLAAGFFAQFGHTMVLREVMAITHGTEAVFGLVFAGWLACAALGALAGAAARLVKSAAATPSASLLATLWLMGPFLAAQMLALRLIPWPGMPQPGEALPFVAAALPALAGGVLPGFLAGLQLSLAFAADPKRFSLLLGAGTAGAVAAGCVTAFPAATLSAPLASALALGAFLGAGTAFVFRPDAPGRVMPPFLLLIALAALAPLAGDQTILRPYSGISGTLAQEPLATPYGRLVVLDQKQSGQPEVYLNSARFAPPSPDADQTSRPLAALLLGQHEAPENVLLAGGALTGLPWELVVQGATRLDLAELDPELLALAARLDLVPKAGIARLVGADVRRLIQAAPPGTWDLIVIVLPEPDNALAARLATLEFFREAKRALTPGGTLCLLLPGDGPSPDAASGNRMRRTAGIMAGLAQVFAVAQAAPAGGHLLAASDNPKAPCFDPDDLALRAAKRLAGSGLTLDEPLSEAGLEAAFADALGSFSNPGPAWARLQASLAREVPVQASRDLHPAVIFTALDFSAPGEGFAERVIARMCEILPRLSTMRDFWPVLAAIALAGLAARRVFARRPGAFAPFALLAGASAGAAGMGLTLVCLAYFQNAFGFVYSQAGLLTALFLAGLGAGAALGAKRPAVWVSLICLAGLAGLCLAAPDWLAVCTGTAGRAGVLILLALTGAALGATLSGLPGLFSRPGSRAAPVLVCASALGGALAAALVLSLAALPLLGAPESLGLTAAPCLAAAAGLLPLMGKPAV